MFDGIPIGTVCMSAGQVHPYTGDANNIWAGTGCSSQNSQAGTLNPDIPLNYLESLGWMFCDGRYLSKESYPELYAVIGDLYGAKNDTFRIPDYRGLFMRGVDAGSGMDPDAATRIGPDGVGTSSGVGSLQCDMFQEHTHDYNSVQLSGISQQGQTAGINASSKPTTSPNAPASFGVETRPKNIAVNYIIKFR